MGRQLFMLAHDDARASAIAAIKTAPAGHIVTIREPTRTLEQNALIHALLQEVGARIGWRFNGVDVDVDDLKSVFMAAFRKATGAESRFVIGIDGQPVILNWRTRDLTKHECANFIDMVNAWLAESRVGQ